MNATRAAQILECLAAERSGDGNLAALEGAAALADCADAYAAAATLYREAARRDELGTDEAKAHELAAERKARRYRDELAAMMADQWDGPEITDYINDRPDRPYPVERMDK